MPKLSAALELLNDMDDDITERGGDERNNLDLRRIRKIKTILRSHIRTDDTVTMVADRCSWQVFRKQASIAGFFLKPISLRYNAPASIRHPKEDHPNA